MPDLMKGKKPGNTFALGFTMRGQFLILDVTQGGMRVHVPMTRAEHQRLLDKANAVAHLYDTTHPTIPIE